MKNFSCFSCIKLLPLRKSRSAYEKALKMMEDMLLPNHGLDFLHRDLNRKNFFISKGFEGKTILFDNFIDSLIVPINPRKLQYVYSTPSNSVLSMKQAFFPHVLNLIPNNCTKSYNWKPNYINLFIRILVVQKLRELLSIMIDLDIGTNLSRITKFDIFHDLLNRNPYKTRIDFR